MYLEIISNMKIIFQTEKKFHEPNSCKILEFFDESINSISEI